ncbi:MAG: hypothetical protein ACYDAC_02705 [Candidatus Dormibacteria bacterium]
MPGPQEEMKMQQLVALERWKLALALGATLVVGLVVGFLVERGRVSARAPAADLLATPSPVVASPTLLPTPSASATPSPTPTSTPTVAPSATAAATLAPDPPVSNGSKVFSQSGSGGQTSTVPAPVRDNWALSYSFLCGGGGNFSVTIRDASGGTVYADPPFAVDSAQARGVQQFAQGGTGLQVQISADASCQWSYEVVSS